MSVIKVKKLKFQKVGRKYFVKKVLSGSVISRETSKDWIVNAGEISWIEMLWEDVYA